MKCLLLIDLHCTVVHTKFGISGSNNHSINIILLIKLCEHTQSATGGHTYSKTSSYRTSRDRC